MVNVNFGSEQSIAKLEKDWSLIAGEKVSVIFMSDVDDGGDYYGFCSELGAYRLYYKYKLYDNTAIGITHYPGYENKWFFSLQVGYRS
jgi:hypothetical protein